MSGLNLVTNYLHPNPWVAWRTYKSSSETRSIIANEKTHEKIFLEAESAELWSMIEKGIMLSELKLHSIKLGVDDDLQDFLEELLNLELISDGEINEHPTPDAVPESKDIELAENAESELEFQQWVMANGFMYSTHWELTYRCNERCSHCYNPGAAHLDGEIASRDVDELSTEQVLKTLERLADGGVFILTLSGGEILLRKDFFEIAAYARKLGMAVNVYTNGLRLNEEDIIKLANLWPSNVSISIYSAQPEVHDQITKVPGSFNKSVAALKSLNSHGIRTSLKSVQFNHTFPAYFGVRELASNLGAVPEIELGLSPGVDGSIAPMLMGINDPRELIVAAMTKGFPVFVGDKENNYGEFVKDKSATVCAAGLAGLSFGADGNIYPCNSLQIKSGNLKEHDPLHIWNAALLQRKYKSKEQDARINSLTSDIGSLAAASDLAKWQDIRLEDYEECGTHRRCNWCVKCPGMSLMETGRELAPSTTNCRIATARMFAAILLAAGFSRDQVADKLGVSQNFGVGATRDMDEIVEPRDRQNIKFYPKKINKDNIRENNISSASKIHSYTTPNGEVWLRNGSEWNVSALRSFESVREIFDELNIRID